MIISRIFILIFFTGILYSQTKDKIASFNYVEGNCLSQNNQIHQQFYKVIPGRNIYSGDIIKTKENSYCTIQFSDNKTNISLGPNSTLQILDYVNTRELKIDVGSLYIKNVHDENKKTYVFTTIIVAVHNSINTNEFSYDEEKN